MFSKRDRVRVADDDNEVAGIDDELTMIRIRRVFAPDGFEWYVLYYPLSPPDTRALDLCF